MRTRVLLGLMVLSGALGAQNFVEHGTPGQREKPALRLWSISVSEMIAGVSVDAWSSLRMNSLAAQGLVHESNGIYSDQSGRYVASRAMPIEYGAYAGIAVGEYFLMRKHPGLSRYFSVVNFGLGGISFGAAFHNVALYNKMPQH